MIFRWLSTTPSRRTTSQKDICIQHLAFLGFDLVSLTSLLLGIIISLPLIPLKKQSISMATWSSQLSIYSLTCWGCFGTFLSSLQISYHETAHQNIGLFKPLRDHNANIPLYIPTFGESINYVTQLQMHEALQSIEVHNLLKIMLNNLYWGYRFPCGILVSCLNDKFAFIPSENSVVPFFLVLSRPAQVHQTPPDLSVELASFHELFKFNTPPKLRARLLRTCSSLLASAWQRVSRHSE